MEFPQNTQPTLTMNISLSLVRDEFNRSNMSPNQDGHRSF